MIRSQKHFYNLTGTTKASLDALLLNIDKYYYQKPQPKVDKLGNPKLKDGKYQYRLITPSLRELKKLQKLVCKKILVKIPLPECAYGCIKGKSNITNALKHKGKKYKFLTDLKDFFPSINSKMVYNSLIKEGFIPDVARLITRITTYKNQLPQGAPTSPYIANIVFKSVDLEIQGLISNNQITYTRFVDDLTFSSPFKFSGFHSAIAEIITKNGFKISRSKTLATSGKVDITGVKVCNNIVGITDTLKVKMSLSNLSEESKRGCFTYKEQVIRNNKNIVKLN